VNREGMKTYQVRSFGKTYTETACKHLIEIAELAIKYDMDLTTDYGIGDSWCCNTCNKSVSMKDLIDVLKREPECPREPP